LKIPVVTATDLVAFLDANGDAEKNPPVFEGPDDVHLSPEDLEQLVADFLERKLALTRSGVGTKEQENQIDAFAAHRLLSFIDKLNASTVLDPGFWAYLSWRLFEVISWRHDGGKYVNFGANFANLQESFLGRSYLRGKIGVTKARIDVAGSDLWRSHIIRVKAGNSTAISGALLDLVDSKKLTSKDLRPLARMINAYRSNVVFELLTEAGAKAAVGLIWEEYEKSQLVEPSK
jgi:hypothetical protein